jgi:hypothetical protein
MIAANSQRGDLLKGIWTGQSATFQSRRGIAECLHEGIKAVSLDPAALRFRDGATSFSFWASRQFSGCNAAPGARPRT